MASAAMTGSEVGGNALGFDNEGESPPESPPSPTRPRREQQKPFGDFWHNEAESPPSPNSQSPRVWKRLRANHETSSVGSAGSHSPRNKEASNARAAQFLTENRFAIHPDKSKPYFYFKIILLLVFICTLVITPFEIAFLDQESAVGQFFVLNRIVDVIHLIDLILCFHLMYPFETGRTVVWVSSKGLLATHYLKTWFLPDSLGVVPFDLLAYAIYRNDERHARVLRLFPFVQALPWFQGASED